MVLVAAANFKKASMATKSGKTITKNTSKEECQKLDMDKGPPPGTDFPESPGNKETQWRSHSSASI